MYEPQYADYSLAELEECLKHLDSDSYPDRHHRLLAEIALRRRMGEAAVEPCLNELLPEDVPFTLGIRALWCFLWRMATTVALWLAALRLMNWLNQVLQLVPASIWKLFLIAASIIFLALTGTLIMMQVLAKRYPGYRIRVIRSKEFSDKQGRDL